MVWLGLIVSFRWTSGGQSTLDWEWWSLRHRVHGAVLGVAWPLTSGPLNEYFQLYQPHPRHRQLKGHGHTPCTPLTSLMWFRCRILFTHFGNTLTINKRWTGKPCQVVDINCPEGNKKSSNKYKKQLNKIGGWRRDGNAKKCTNKVC